MPVRLCVAAGGAACVRTCGGRSYSSSRPLPGKNCGQSIWDPSGARRPVQGTSAGRPARRSPIGTVWLSMRVGGDAADAPRSRRKADAREAVVVLALGAGGHNGPTSPLFIVAFILVAVVIVAGWFIRRRR
jgi:hypothetical protein